MCRTYEPKGKPVYTRLCSRYRERAGDHVPGHYPCGTYPRPGRVRGDTSRSATPRPKYRPCACGKPGVSADGKCEQCYIDAQLAQMDDATLNHYGLTRPDYPPN